MVAPTVRIIETPTLGNRSYVVHDGVVALAIDPPRDIDRIVETLEADGVELVAVFETHIHNDYVTGGLALADRFSATYHVHAQDSVAFDRRPIVGGDSVDVGDRLQVTAVATPGHTFHHLSYRIDDRADDRVIGIFTGGSLLYGATGRPDLLGPEHTDEPVADVTGAEQAGGRQRKTRLPPRLSRTAASAAQGPFLHSCHLFLRLTGHWSFKPLHLSAFTYHLVVQRNMNFVRRNIPHRSRRILMTAFNAERDIRALDYEEVRSYVAEGRRQQGAAIRSMTSAAARGIGRLVLTAVHGVRHALHLDGTNHANPAR